MSVLEQAETLMLSDGTELTLRSPVPDDAAALLAYLDAVRRETPNLCSGPGDALPSVAEERAWIEGAVAGPVSIQILAEHAGEPVALAGLQGSGAHFRTGHRAELGISVRRDWHGRGLGRLLMERLLVWAHANPALELVTLGMHHDNAAARRLYTSLGFVEDGRAGGCWPGLSRRWG